MIVTDAQPAPPRTEYAGAWIRFAALLIDGIVLFLLVAAVLLVGTVGIIVLAPATLDANTLGDLEGWPGGVVVYAIASAVVLCWYAAWQAATGWTPAMRLLQLRVRGAGQRDKPSAPSAVLRNLPFALLGSGGGVTGIPAFDIAVTLAGLVMYGSVGVTISKDPMRRGWHDRLAGGTTVVHHLNPDPRRPMPSTGAGPTSG